MPQAAKRRLRSDPLSFHLSDFSNESWGCSVAGPLNQAMRRKAVAQARNFLWNFCSQPTQRFCFDILELRAAEIHNYRPPNGNEETYLQFRLEMLACIRWLREYGEMNYRMFIDKIAHRTQCEEITALFAGKLIE